MAPRVRRRGAAPRRGAVARRYNGVKLSDTVRAGVQSRRRYVITKLPKFLVFHFGRFTKNNFYSEKNPTIVHMPVKDLELKDQFALEGEAAAEGAATKYDLLANACHDLPAGVGKEAQADPLQHGTFRVHARRPSPGYRDDLRGDVADRGRSASRPRRRRDPACAKYLRRGRGVAATPRSKMTFNELSPESGPQVHQKSSDQWYEIQDLHVSETMPQLIGLSESLLAIYQRRDA